MGLGEAAEAFGPVLTMIGGLAVLGRQILPARPGTPAPAALSTPPVALPAPSEPAGAGVTVVVHMHLPCAGCDGQVGEAPR